MGARGRRGVVPLVAARGRRGRQQRAHVRILPVDVATIGDQFPELVVVTVTCGVPHRRGLEQRDDRRVPLLPCNVESRLA